MKLHYAIEPLKFKTIEELPNAWSSDNYRDLLDRMEYGDSSDLSEQELKEMCFLSLSDNEPEEAAKIVLEYLFGEILNKGQIDNISHEMVDEKMWEEYADLSMHEGFFNATQILYQAYNGKFPHPEAIWARIKISPKEKLGLKVFDQNSEAALIRLLVQGMSENTLIHRLFDEQLEGGDFADARDIIWQYKMETVEDTSIIFEITSSEYWFLDLKYVKHFEAILEDEESTP